MHATFSELINQQKWKPFSTHLGLNYLGIDVEPADYCIWNIPEDFDGNISLIAEGKGVRLLSVSDSTSEKKLTHMVRLCSLKTEDRILWVVLGETPRLAFFDKLTLKIKSVEVFCLDSKDLDFEKRPDESLTEIFDTSELTESFFRNFRKSHQLLANAIENGPQDYESRNRVALTWLLRITFLYFAQSHGALNGDLNYLAKALNIYTSKSEHQFHLIFLNVIFFDLLNTQTSKRKWEAKKLGAIPFLNGGLFEPSSDEVKWKTIVVHNSVWSTVFKTLFEKYKFVSERANFVDANAIDPEMLGKVFEALMSVGDRKRTGAFYTPRKIIRSMVEEGIYGCLVDKIEGLDSKCLSSDLRCHPKRDKIIAKLNSLRILDPAVGTGGFLMDALHVIQDLRQRLGLPYEGKEIQILIHRHLFGVDKNPIAIRLCELRFWLQILTSYGGSIRELPPLPNLSHRFVSGDALLDPFETVSSSITRARWKSIADLQRDFSRSHGSIKHALKHRIDREKRNLQMAEILIRKQKQIEEKTLLDVALSGKDLLGAPIKSTRFQNEVLRNNIREESELVSLEERVKRSAEAPVFSFHSQFPDVMRRGGFDLILMNPPWVRHHHIPSKERKILEKRYGSNSGKLWTEAKSQNVRSRYGSQNDLSSMFLEKATELCRPHGRVVALVPSKIMRGISSAPIRGLLGRLDLQTVTDLSESNERLFDATTYPAIVSFRNQKPQGRLRTSSSEDGTEDKDRNELMLFGDDFRAPWTCQNRGLVSIIREVALKHRPLGSFSNLQPRRGIYTGSNEIFVKRCGDFPPSFSKYLRPVVEGKGRKRELLYLYDAKGIPLVEVADEVEDYFERNRSKLLARADHNPKKPLWQIFRNHRDLFGPKIIWKDISKWFEPLLDNTNAIPLNTIYLIPCRDTELGKRLIRYFKSDFVQAFVRLLGERVSGGHRRHFAWAIQCIPIPERVIYGEGRGLELNARDKKILLDFVENEKL